MELKKECEGEKLYKEINKKRLSLTIIFLLLLAVVIILDIAIGPSNMPVTRVIKAVFNFNQTGSDSVIIWQIRMPMTMACIFVGASLGLAGTIMQTILNNPLASPYTLGISSASAFGASIAILTGFNFFGMVWLGIPIAAFGFSLIASFGIYLIGKYKGMSSTTMILSGIVIHFLFQALQSIVQYIATPEISQQIVFWMFGSLLKANWKGVTGTAVIFFICSFILLLNIWRITALSAGEERARSLGINTNRLRKKLFLLSALLTAGAVSFVGTIGFIGLVSPHFAKMAVGEDQRYLSPVSALIGSLLLCTASIVAKIVKPGAMLPIGVVTSLIGIPFLLYIILRRRY
jgi:iron complex transport system permease protein